MPNTETGIGALEASASDSSIKIIVAEGGETPAEAFKRVGLEPDALRVMCVTPLDVKL